MQAMNVPVTTWLVRLWDTRVDGISQATVEAKKPNNITSHPSSRQKMHNLRQ